LDYESTKIRKLRRWFIELENIRVKMIITRKELVKICDRYLDDKVSKEELIHFARTVMFDDENRYECEDALVEEILSQWDNTKTQSKINKTSIQFLRNALSDLN